MNNQYYNIAMFSCHLSVACYGGYVGHFDPTVPNNEKCITVYIRYCWVKVTPVLPLFPRFLFSFFYFLKLKMMFY